MYICAVSQIMRVKNAVSQLFAKKKMQYQSAVFKHMKLNSNALFPKGRKKLVPVHCSKKFVYQSAVSKGMKTNIKALFFKIECILGRCFQKGEN